MRASQSFRETSTPSSPWPLPSRLSLSPRTLAILSRRRQSTRTMSTPSAVSTPRSVAVTRRASSTTSPDFSSRLSSLSSSPESQDSGFSDSGESLKIFSDDTTVRLAKSFHKSKGMNIFFYILVKILWKVWSQP